MRLFRRDERANAAGPPCPDVRFAPDFLLRVGRLALRVAAARERREGAGRASLLGAGEELVGYRPYRPGEDLRALDWSLLARLDRPFVRVMRREAGERWLVALDASASMGVGPPGKLQRAAEVACALACVGARLRARVRVLAAGAEGVATLELGGRADAARLCAFFERLRAGGDAGLARLAATPRRVGDAGRVFLVGDLLDLEPEAAARLARRGRQLACAQLLAPLELEPEAGPAAWFDPEDGARVELAAGPAALASYGRRLERRLEHWRGVCAHHGIAYGCWSTRTEFEDVAAGLLGL